MLLVLLVACAAPQWPAPCPGVYHSSEAHYAVAFKKYSALVANFTSTRQRAYNLAVNEYQTKWRPYERAVANANTRFVQILRLHDVPVPRLDYGQLLSPRLLHQLGEHDEKLYWEAIKALGPKPVLRVLRPYHLIDVVGVKLLAILTAHTRRIAAWQADVFDMKKAKAVFGKLQVIHDTHTLTATRDAFVLTGIGICNRGPIPSREQFEELYNETRVYA